MTCLNNRKNDSFILSTIDELVPSDHKVRELEEAIDWTFIYPLVRPLYSSFGRPSIDPVVLFKMLFINFTFGIHSMRRTCEEIKVNLAYRWFLGLSIDDEVPNYSTWSQNYIRRYGDSEIFDEIFNRIIEEAIAYDFVDLDTVFGDGTHRKANANSRKHENKVVEIVKKHYDDELLEEKVYINKTMDERYPLMVRGIYEDGKLQMVIMLWGLNWEKMTLGRANFLTADRSVIEHEKRNKTDQVLNKRYQCPHQPFPFLPEVFQDGSLFIFHLQIHPCASAYKEPSFQ